jgi:hypothetical protein
MLSVIMATERGEYVLQRSLSPLRGEAIHHLVEGSDRPAEPLQKRRWPTWEGEIEGDGFLLRVHARLPERSPQCPGHIEASRG